jgi:hypothetical protein
MRYLLQPLVQALPISVARQNRRARAWLNREIEISTAKTGRLQLNESTLAINKT